MSGDYTRFTFDPLKRYSGVWMQQGRVQLDADWNEGVDILKDRVRKLSLDVLGRVGVPYLVTPNAFAIGVIPGPPLDLSIGAGRIYVDGYMAENFIPPATYLTQPFLPAPPPLPPPPLVPPVDVLVILDLWEREVTYIEDPKLLDVALGGVDTTTRIQQVWQLRVVPPPPGEGAQCGVDLDALFPPSAGRLTTEAIAPPTPDDPCILPPVAGYRGLENRLYRLEIHDGGPLGVARFKWSRDDGSIVSAVTAMAVAGGQTRINVNRLGRDQVLRFRIDDWVTITDDWRELHEEPGEMAKIVNIDEATPAIVLDRVLPSPGGRAFGALPADLVARHTRVQLWNQNPAVNVLDVDGLMMTAPGPIDIEDGIRVRFNMTPVGGSFHVGDYWMFAARTADASVEILTQAPPRGIIHHYAQLAAITGLGGANIVSDCRPPHHDCACCCVINVAPPGDPVGDFHSLADAIAALPGLPINPAAPVLICLTAGEHPIAAPINLDRPFVTIRGCGMETIVRPRTGFINMNAEFQYLENFVIRAESAAPLIGFFSHDQGMTQIWAHNNGPGPIAIARRAHELAIKECLIDGQGGLDLSVIELDVLHNHVTRGTVAIRGSSLNVRIHDNRMEDSFGHGITFRGESYVGLVDIHRNEIWRARGNGIGFDGGDFGPIAAGITIAHNLIAECVSANAVAGAMPAGGIILGRAAELEIRDNRIADNGKEVAFAVCGIYVMRSWGVGITRNLISGNGRPADDGAPFPGHQAGIYLAEALIGVGSTPDPATPGAAVMTVGNVPAARITENDIDAPRAHALVILGVGPMSIESNRLQCHDIMREGGAGAGTPLENMLSWIGAVAIVNFGLPSWLYYFLLATGFSGAAGSGTLSFTGFSLPMNSLVGGQVQFRGNQVRLDLSQVHAEMALANIFIMSLDDIQFVDNQSEGVLRYNPGPIVIAGPVGGPTFDFLLGDLTAFSITLRQADNGLFTTPYLTAFSILSQAYVNHCLGNQTTSCILAVGGAPKSKRRDNAVLFPHPLFCRTAGRGDD
jgi:hypothetical protein